MAAPPATGRHDPLQYLCADGFRIDIDAGIVVPWKRIHSPGRYYAFGRIGMILLVPRTRRVCFLYNG